MLQRVKFSVGWLIVSAILFAALMVHRGGGHDYIQFHAAAELLSSSNTPYGHAEQWQAQRDLREGVDLRELEPNDLYSAIGILPYFYPPWVALAVIPLTMFRYAVAKAIWIYLCAQALILAGFLSSPSGRRYPTLTVGFAIAFMPAFSAVEIGQVAPFVLLFVVVSARLLEKESDVAAGFVLAWFTIKPQLSVIALPATLIWAARRGRWKVVTRFAFTLATLAIISAEFLPDWPLRMIAAPRQFPLPTSIDPSVGVTWLTFCQTLGFNGMTLACVYALAAIPATALALHAAWDQNTSIKETLGRGVLAAFFVAPYALGYDLAMLVFPFFVVNSRLTGRASVWLFGVGMLVPYWTLWAVQSGVPQVAFFWMPVALALLWVSLDYRNRRRLIPPAV